jgi:hypothetical protein
MIINTNNTKIRSTLSQNIDGSLENISIFIPPSILCLLVIIITVFHKSETHILSLYFLQLYAILKTSASCEYEYDVLYLLNIADSLI